MKKAEVLAKVAAKSGVDQAECAKVVDSLEAVLQQELTASGKMSGVLSLAGLLFDYLGRKK